MTNAILVTIIANSVPFILAIFTWLKLRKTERRLADKDGREMDIKEAASSLDGWKALNKFLSEEVSRGNEDRARLWRAQLDCEEMKSRLEKKVSDLEERNRALVKEVELLKEQLKEVQQLKQQVKELLEKLKK